ncbi:hypothetical protein JCM11641_003443 [Rhodosporidiobolus odoratus]
MSLQAGQKRQRPEKATHEPSTKRHRPNSPPPSHANIDLDQYPIPSPLIKPSVSHQDPRLVPSSFSPSKTPFSGWNTRQLKSNYRSARESWRWEVMEKRGAGESRIPKPPSLVAMEIEMKRRKDAGVWQERTFDLEWPARSRRTGAQGNSAPANAFRRRKPMGSDKKTPSSLPTSRRPVPPSSPPPLPDDSHISLRAPRFSRSSSPARSPTPVIPAPSLMPKPPWAPSYDPSAFSPPPSPRLRPRPSTDQRATQHHVPSDPDAPALPPHRSVDPAALTFSTTARPAVSVKSRSSSSRSSSKQHKASLVDRDLGVLHALQNGAEVVSPGASSSGLNGSASRSSEAREADDYDYFESLRGACVSQEEAQRLEDKEIYRRAIEERMRVQDGDQSASNIHITRHPASAGARQRQQPRTTFSLINPNAYFPEASPFVSTLRHTKPAKPSKIPVPSSSRSIDLILGKAKKTGLEPKYSGDAFERYEALTQAVAEVEDLEEEEAARQKRRIYPEALSSEHRAIVKAALYGSDYYKTIPGAEVRTADIRRLRPGTWLNDESINYVGILINQRSNEADASDERGEGEKKLRKVFCMRTNFYETFTKQGFAKVKRWTKKFDTFEKDIIIIPINQGGAHWVCAAVNIAKKRIEFYDSMGQPRPKVYQNLRSWLEQEHMNRKKAPIDLSDWENYWDEDRPEQGNGYDCGIFTCSFMESLSREVTGFDFTQDNMDYLRQKVVLTIDQGKLLELEEWQ